MRVSEKVMVFAVCGITIFCLSVIHQACGDEKQTKQQIAGYMAEFSNLDTLLQGVGGAVLGCPKQSCNDYEEEAAKMLISHLLTRKSGAWLYKFILEEGTKELFANMLFGTYANLVPIAEVEVIDKIKERVKKMTKEEVKPTGFKLNWKNIWGGAAYLPYETRDGPYGKADGEALVVFYSPDSIPIQEIKKQVESAGGHFEIYIPPMGPDKIKQLPNSGTVRPFVLVIRGTVHEKGDYNRYEVWGDTIDGPKVTFSRKVLTYEEAKKVSFDIKLIFGEQKKGLEKVTNLQLVSRLKIIDSPPYKAGQALTAEFSIRNNGTVPVTFDVLTVGGRINDICPNDKCPDFEWKKDIALNPNETYHYSGKLRIESIGDYHFFTAYKIKDSWSTAIPAAPGVTNTIDITVKPSIEKQDKEVRVKECRPPTGKIAFVREIGNTQGGRWIDSEIFVINADGTNEVRLTNNFVKDEDPDWSPDGRKIAFSSRRNGNSEIYVMNADGTGLRNLTNNAAQDAFPSWSPDGTKIAFHSDRYGSIQIYVMNADGSNQTRLTYNPPRNSKPRWSPDGSKITFESFRDGNGEVYVMNADGSNQTRLTYTGSSGDPYWSPNGSMIAFDSYLAGKYSIYVMNANGSNQRPLTNNPWDDYDPAWSPDGNWIAFVSSRDGHLEIYIMKADGSCQTRLTKNKASDYSPSFWTIRK